MATATVRFLGPCVVAKAGGTALRMAGAAAAGAGLGSLSKVLQQSTAQALTISVGQGVQSAPVTQGAVQYVSPTAVAFRSGNTLVIMDLQSGKQRILAPPQGVVIDAFAVASEAKPTATIAVAVHGEGAGVLVYSWPRLTLCKVLKEG